jgi:sugar/nucleoside kinase (ribokinase family)
MNKKYDVAAIGNALVDYEIEVEDHFLSANNVEKGLMTLVDEERQHQLLNKSHEAIRNRQSGGSAANTIYGFSQLGGSSFYMCKVANDDDGTFYMNSLREQGIATNLNGDILEEGVTGKCLVMISPDTERTMNTFLGITTDFSKSEIREDAIRDAKYLFMEGFLVSSANGVEAMMYAKKIAVENGAKVSLTFSDPSVVKYFKDQMKSVVGEGVDLLFCNIEEAQLFTGKEDLEDVKKELEKVAGQFVITFSEKGSLVYDGQQYTYIDPFKVKAVDSTGAGDMFAGAYLYGLIAGFDHAKAGKLASAASAQVVSRYGPRLTMKEIEEVLQKIGE